jgi:threonine 3-dehydrogenase
MAAAIAKHAGARNIVVTDPNPFRLGLAKKAGATRVVNPEKENLAQVQKELGMREGFDVAMEMSGSPAALDAILDNMFHGGKIALLGILPEKIPMDWNKVIFNMLSIKGIYGRQMFETWYKMTAMVQSGLDISPLITHRFHYTEFQKGFDVMRTGKSGKVILDWD